VQDHTDVRTGNLYRSAGESTKELLGELIEQKAPIFAMPSWFVTADAAQVGFLLSEVLRELCGGPPGESWRSFFANSRYEAIHGAIKLMRHGRAESIGEHRGRVLMLDSGDGLRADFDPLGEGPERALVPGVIFVRSVDDLRIALDSGTYCAMLVREPAVFARTELADAVAAARDQGLTVAADLSDSDLSESSGALSRRLTEIRPDIVVVGEHLTDSEVPFGAFAGTAAAFEPWTRPENAFLHSNTYGGNTLAMRKVKERLLRHFEPDHRARDVVARAERDWDRALGLYGRHVNAATERMHRTLRGALHVVRAEGARLTVELDSGRRLELVDGVCGGGLGVNGHNPPDARTEVLRRHDPTVDYVGRLESLLAAETGLARVFPQVSGAGAVETALTLALLAQRGRRRIIVFDHNYGGKTLVALLATAATRSRAPFGPLYDGVRYLDPFASDAAARLEEELASDEVALVWLELVHGSSDSYAALPDDLLAIIARERDRRGFLVGVDEILTSYYRCGRRFAFRGRLPEVDLVTVSKALSYLCFPVSAAVVSESVYERAARSHPRLVEDLKARYANQLGAHFAVHSLTRVDELDLADRTDALARGVRDGIATMDARSRSVDRRFAEGLFVRLEMVPPKLPGPLAKHVGDLSVLSTILWWVTRARVFVLYDCFGIPLIAGADDISRINAGVRALSKKSPYGLLWSAFVFIAKEKASRVLRLRSKANSRRNNEG
jgi:acetylornithine/succinyldiaminopimelate/putrescine aminotransferase